MSVSEKRSIGSAPSASASHRSRDDSQGPAPAPKRDRSSSSTTLAECEGCDWRDERAGATGRAALHHDRTGHEVRIERTTVIRYGNREATLAAQGQERLDGVE